MEKLSITSSFHKSLEVLRATDNSKEKLHHFSNLSDCLRNSHLHGNYQQFVSPAISILILFCEDGVDSTVRMCAYENLIKVLRICEAGQQIRKVMIDLYHEIKRNGNERSLRICLNLFGYFIRHVNQKKIRVYVQNLLPCLHAICQRRETMLLESLTDFLRTFCGHWSLSMTESEAIKLIEVFLNQLTVSCATKRRCMAQNALTLIERHRKRHEMAIYTLNRSTEVLIRNRDDVNTTLGVLGLWRLLTPLCLDELEEENAEVREKLLEIFDLSVQYLLSCPNHSVINATLEVLYALTVNIERRPRWRRKICDNNPNDILSKRNSLKMSVCGKEAAIEKITEIMPKEDTVFVSLENDQITLEMIESTETLSDEFNPEKVSLRSLKSEDSSLGGFIHSIFPSTSEFFKNQRIFPDSPQSGTISKQSKTSGSSSSPVHTPLKVPRTVPPSPSQEAESLNFTPLSQRLGNKDYSLMEFKECPVFGISDLREQSILSYSMRVLCSSYLLTGKKNQLISDGEIRVSIKHLSLVVIANILSVLPELFLQPLNLSSETESLDIECERIGENQREEVAGPSVLSVEKLMDIKEDHFGPPSSSSAIDYLSPLLSKSVDGGSSSSEMGAMDPRMTHSEVIFPHEDGQVRLRVKMIKQFRESEQFIYELLLLRNHSDPMLRSDVIFIVENFLKGILSEGEEFSGFLDKWKTCRDGGILTLEGLYDVLLKGLQDEHHAVIKHALSTIPVALSFLRNCTPSPLASAFADNLVSESFNIAEGKPYWINKSHLCEVIPKIQLNWQAAHSAEDDLQFLSIREKSYNLLISFLHDEDSRVRIAAAKGLLDLIAVKRDRVSEDIIQEYIHEKVFVNLAFPLRLLLTMKTTCDGDLLRRLLFDLSNQLMDVGNKHSVSGIITCLRAIMESFPPVEHFTLWDAFNFLPILENYLQENSLVIFDIVNHTEALKLYGELLAGKAVHRTVSNDELTFLLEHSLQIMNLFTHILTNQKPLLTSIVQKSDIFMSERELAKIQQLGYFGNKPVYLRIFKLVKVIYDTYNLDVNREVEERLRNLLRSAMESLNLVLELKPVTSISQSTKLVEEILSFLNALLVWEPVATIATAKFLFKYFFERNFVARKKDYQYFLENFKRDAVAISMEKIAEFNVMKPGEFYQEEESHIKLFEPIVIKSLRMYMRAEPKHQSHILEFICQLLTLNVNYSMLDSNLEFFKFVQDQLDTIEGGRVAEAELLIENLIRFLFLLNNKKLTSTPVVIHMTDNLLANQNIRKCSLRALVQLSHEIFFNKTSVEGGGGESNFSELNTEKEFIFSILMKFLDDLQVQKCVYLILSTHGDILEYKKSVQEAIFAMIEKFQTEDAGIELNLVKKLLEKSSSESFGEKATKAIERILSQLSFEMTNPLGNWQILSTIANVIIFQGTDNKLDKLTVEKYIEMNRNLPQIVDQLVDEETLLDAYETNRWPINSLPRNLKEELRESSGELSLEMIFKIRLNHTKLFLLIVEDWIEIGVIEDYGQVIKKLDCELNVDKVLLQKVVKKIVDLGTKDPKVISKYLPILKASNEMALKITSDSQKVSIGDENILEIIQSMCKSTGPKSITSHNLILNCLEEISLKDSNWDIEILTILSDFLTLGPKILSRNRAKHLCKAIWTRSESDTRTTITENIPDIEGKLGLSLYAEFKPLPDISSDNLKIDEPWIWSQIGTNLSNANHTQVQFAILLTMKSDLKVGTLLDAIELRDWHYIHGVRAAFQHMISSFQRDCIAYSPHVNYLKIPFLLKYFLDQLIERHSSINSDDPRELMRILSTFLVEYNKLEEIALKLIELRLWDKFAVENLVKSTMIEFIMEVFGHQIKKMLSATDEIDLVHLEDTLEFIVLVLENTLIFRNWNSSRNYQLHFEKFVSLINFIYEISLLEMKNKAWIRDYKGIGGFFDEANSDPELLDLYSKVSFLIKLREEYNQKLATDNCKIGKICRIIQNIVRFSQIYPMAVIPHKYLRTVCDNLQLMDRLKCPVPIMSIGDLKDSDTLKDFVANVKGIGFTSRQQFEEYLMTLLVLLNTEFDEAEYDSQEQYVIRKTCFSSITELLVTIKECPRIGLASGRFYHTSRNATIPEHLIHLKKLKEVLSIIPGCSPLETSNLERDLSDPWNCNSQSAGFHEGQFNLPTIWQILEEDTSTDEKTNSSESNLCLKNCAYDLEWFEIDYNSSVKMVLEMSTQLYDIYGETYLSFFLPCMVQMVDLFVTRDQYKWLKQIVYRLHETVLAEDSNAHQHIVYLMCKTNAVLVASPSEVSHLTQTVLPSYLKSKSHGILAASLRGILVLFESCFLTNSTIGGLSEELNQLRKLVLSYADKYLSAGEAVEGDEEYQDYAKTLWATIFYTLETTNKFIDDKPLMGKVILALNRILRRSPNVQLQCTVINGIARLILAHCVAPSDVEKVTRIALEVIKQGQESLAMPGLKLLVTCIYFGSSEQLERTQLSNGVVQDDPETILNLMEKIDVLFNKIKMSGPSVARVYGMVLAHVIRDLIPAKDVLTKVIKEMIKSTQPHIDLMVHILHQVFRSSIDAAYLPLLQDWLVCSLNNFLVLHEQKTVWFLTVIFISATLNVNLLKIFPQIAAFSQFDTNDEKDIRLQHEYFAIATVDFYVRLSEGQKKSFIESLTNCPHIVIHSVGKILQKYIKYCAKSKSADRGSFNLRK